MILTISGSVRARSGTRAAVEALTEVLGARGAPVEHWDLRTRPLPVADPDYQERAREHPDPAVRELAAAVGGASAVVLATPVYHNSFSGVLKNCLDHLSIADFAYRPVGLLAHGDNLSAVQACDQLRLVVRGLRGLALPVQVVTTPGDLAVADGVVKVAGDDATGRLERFAVDLLLYARLSEPMLRRTRAKAG
jgi:NAD(P)H-dependent FMN reductase